MSTIGILPCEVLMKIFRYLGMSDKLNLRLTCKYWHSVCSELLVVNFVLRSDAINFNSIIEVVTESGLRHLNLEFVDTKFYSTSTMNTFWDKCGFKIKCLYLNECIVSANDLRLIITKCENIEQLSFKNCCIDEMYSTLNSLVADGIRIDSLISLEFNYCGWLIHGVLDRFCILYPKIGNIKLITSWKLVYDYVINTIRAFAEMLVCLDLNYSEVDGFKDKELLDIASIPNLRLKKLCVSNPGEITYGGFKTLFLKHTCLQYLNVFNSFDFTPGNLQELLIHCSNLRTLKIQCTCKHFHRILQLVAISHLEVFEIHGNTMKHDNLSTLTDIQFVDQYLNSLRIIDIRLAEEDYFWIIKMFQDRVLQAITHKETKSKKLELFSDTPYNSSALHCFQSLSKFEDLQFLELRICNTNITNFEHLVFPQLTEVIISMYNRPTEAVRTDRVYDSHIKLFCKNNPSIIYFNLGAFNIHTRVVNSIIMYLPKLRRLELWCFSYNDPAVSFDLNNLQIARPTAFYAITIKKYSEDQMNGRMFKFDTFTYYIFTKELEYKETHEIDYPIDE